MEPQGLGRSNRGRASARHHRAHGARHLVLIVLASTCLVAPVSAAGSVVTLSPPPGSPGEFGQSIARDGNTLVVAAPGAFMDPEGALFVYTRSAGGWSLSAKLTTSDHSDLLGEFGLAIDGDTIVASSLNAAYTFSTTGAAARVETAKLDPIGDVGLWGEVAIDGNTIVVGSGDTPIVYTFSRTGSPQPPGDGPLDHIEWARQRPWSECGDRWRHDRRRGTGRELRR